MSSFLLSSFRLEDVSAWKEKECEGNNGYRYKQNSNLEFFQCCLCETGSFTGGSKVGYRNHCPWVFHHYANRYQQYIPKIKMRGVGNIQSGRTIGFFLKTTPSSSSPASSSAPKLSSFTFLFVMESLGRLSLADKEGIYFLAPFFRCSSSRSL